MTTRQLSTIATAALAMTAASAVGAAPALAAADIANAGKNTSRMVFGVIVPVFGALVALFGITHLGRRDFAQLAVFGGAAFVIGGFVLVPQTMLDFIKSGWQGVAGH